MTVREMLAGNLSLYRNKAGYSQKSAAEALHTKPTTISSWEVGKSQPSADMLVEIALLYKVPLSVLCGMDYDMKISAEEMEIIQAYRNADDYDKTSVLRTLNVADKKGEQRFA